MTGISPSTRMRKSNIELLRVFTMIGVIVLHINNPLFGKCLEYSRDNIYLYNILLIYEGVFICAVDLFLVISGYFMITKTSVNTIKPLMLFIQVVFFLVLNYLMTSIPDHSFSYKNLLGNLIPKNYFVILYCTVYILSPYINKLLNSLSRQSYRILLVICMILFSVIPTLLDVADEYDLFKVDGLYPIGVFGSGYGCTFIGFAFMYIIGGYLSKWSFELLNTRWLLLILSASVGALCVWSHHSIWRGDFSESTSLSYCNPFVIVNAVLIFIVFSRISIPVGRISTIINCIANNCFSVFLTHGIFLRYFDFGPWIERQGVFFCVTILLIAFLLFAMCSTIGALYSCTVGRLVANLLEHISLLRKMNITTD